MKWQRKLGRKGGGRFRFKESLEIPWSRAWSEPGNFVLGSRDHSQEGAAMVSSAPEEAATQRAGRSEGCFLSLSQEHNPGQTISISERPPLFLAQKGLHLLCALFSIRGLQAKYPGDSGGAGACKGGGV